MQLRRRFLPVPLACALLTSIGPVSFAQESSGPTTTLSIGEAESLSEINSRELSIGALQLQKASAGLREAKAMRGPTLNFQGSGSYLSNPMEGISIAKGALGYAPTAQSEAPVAIPDQEMVLMPDGEHSYFKFTATLKQPLFTWGKLMAAIRAAELEVSVAGQDLEITRSKIRRDTRRAYFGALLGRQSLDVLDKAVEISAAILEDRERSFEEGLITRQDVLEAVSQAAQLTAQRARAKESIWSATAGLELLIGQEADDSDLISGYRSKLPEIDEDEFVAKAVQHSPDRAALLSRVDQASEMVKLQKGSRLFLPDFSLNVSVDITGQRVPFIGSRWRESWDANLIISIGTSVNLFDSGAAAAKVDQAEQDLLIAGEGLSALEEGVELQTRTAIYKTEAAWAEIKRTGAALDFVAEREGNAAVGYENGLITRREALLAKIGLLATELEHSVAKYAYEMALTEIEELIGKVLVEDE